MATTLISPISDLVGAADKVVERLDAHAKERHERLRERADLRDAVLDLLHLMREWERAAQITTLRLRKLLASESKENRRELRFAIDSQREAARYVFRSLGDRGGLEVVEIELDEITLEPTGRRSSRRIQPTASISDVLFVYVPEVEQQIRDATSARAEWLRMLAAGQGRGVGKGRWGILNRLGLGRRGARTHDDAALGLGGELSPRFDIVALESTVNALDEAAVRLAKFIEENFDVSDLRVRPTSP